MRLVPTQRHTSMEEDTIAQAAAPENHTAVPIVTGASVSIEYANGDRYTGPIKANKRHGKGTLTYADGCVYEGDFRYDWRQGKGKVMGADGAVYEGDFFCGNRHGKGEYTDPDGRVYKGDFRDDKFHGKGKYTYPDGTVYEGGWRDGHFVVATVKARRREMTKSSTKRVTVRSARERSPARTRHSEGDDDDIGWV